MVLWWVALVGQTPVPLPDPVPTLISLGPLGIVVILLFVGYIWPRPAVDRVIQEADRERARTKELHDLIGDQVLPTLRDVARSIGPGGPLDGLLRTVEETRRQVEEMRRDLRSGGR